MVGSFFLDAGGPLPLGGGRGGGSLSFRKAPLVTLSRGPPSPQPSHGVMDVANAVAAAVCRAAPGWKVGKPPPV